MKYTNKYNLDEVIVKVLSHDTYDHNKDVISTTQLIGSPLQYALKTIYNDELERDISDNCASVFGSAVHSLIEEVNFDIECKKEERLYTDIFIDGKKYTLSGQFDLLIKIDDTNYKLYDTKTTSVWTKIYNSKEDDYIKQLSIYRYLLYKNGYNVIDEATIWWWFTDWSKSQAIKSIDYPNVRTELKNITLMSIEDTENYIKEKLLAMDRAVELVRQGNYDDLEETDKELWRKPNTFALMKCGRKTAIKLFDNFTDAKAAMSGNDGSYVEERKGKIGRCEYCECTNVCPFYKKYLENDLL